MFIHIEDGVLKARVGKYIVYNAEWFKGHFEQERALYGKKEHWIGGGKIGPGMGAHDYICSGCKWHEPDFPERIREMRYCTSCGAQMEIEPLSPSEKWHSEQAAFDPFYENLRPEQEDT